MVKWLKGLFRRPKVEPYQQRVRIIERGTFGTVVRMGRVESRSSVRISPERLNTRETILRVKFDDGSRGSYPLIAFRYIAGVLEYNQTLEEP